MTGTLLVRSFGVLELLARERAGLGLKALSERLGTPVGSMHRLLGDLIALRYVRQDPATDRYHLTTRLLSLGHQHLAATGVADVAQPLLDRLSEESGELARLAVVDGEDLTWVAKAQGARSGLRYDPDMGQNARLFCTASGHAWLATLDDEEAVRIVTHQGFGKLTENGPNAPRTIRALLDRLAKARKRGYATVVDSGAVGTAALAAGVIDAGSRRTLGVISIAGPSVRLTEQRMTELAPALLAAADELAATGQASSYLVARRPQRESAMRGSKT
jgi:IclR family acetate operon transcriptional repressor